MTLSLVPSYCPANRPGGLSSSCLQQILLHAEGEERAQD